ncbi:hypothetical protein OC846_004866 [Tilletia horrida]|uniref:Uncharacterized protein n=1 Tax=Tilletia horrida TaxID=155126 RepID=A0AAN6GPN7_9BASI|nr:hypothetical protein OC846_004866 [Tilletia horrida]KAK0562753.1 hypothetical protein OC861_005153 [Tilletia horrida]
MVVVPTPSREATSSFSPSAPPSPPLTSGAGISPDSEIPADQPCARCARLGKECVWAPSHRTGRPRKNTRPSPSQRQSPTQPSGSTAPYAARTSSEHHHQQQQRHYSDYSPQSDIVTGHGTHATTSPLVRSSSSELLRNFFAEMASMTPNAETGGLMPPATGSPEMAPPPAWSNLHPIAESLQAATTLPDGSSALTSHHLQQQQQQHLRRYHYHHPQQQPGQQQQQQQQEHQYPQLQQFYPDYPQHQRPQHESHDQPSPPTLQPSPFFAIHNLGAVPDVSAAEPSPGGSYWSPPGNLSPHPASMPISQQSSPYPQQQHLFQHRDSGAFLPEAYVSTVPNNPIPNFAPSESDSDFIDRLLGNASSSSSSMHHSHHQYQQQAQQQQQYQQHQHPYSAPTTPLSFQAVSTGINIGTSPTAPAQPTIENPNFFQGQMSHCALQLQQRQMGRSASMSAAAGPTSDRSSPTSNQARSSSSIRTSES